MFCSIKNKHDFSPVKTIKINQYDTAYIIAYCLADVQR
jgi:hypothetical protein